MESILQNRAMSEAARSCNESIQFPPTKVTGGPTRVGSRFGSEIMASHNYSSHQPFHTNKVMVANFTDSRCPYDLLLFIYEIQQQEYNSSSVSSRVAS